MFIKISGTEDDVDEIMGLKEDVAVVLESRGEKFGRFLDSFSRFDVEECLMRHGNCTNEAAGLFRFNMVVFISIHHLLIFAMATIH